MFCGTLLVLLQFATASNTVEIDGSQIIGQQISFEGTYVNQYLGIPYAEPPIGPLRFQKPQPIQSYPPAFKAISNPPACLQFTKQPNLFYINSTHKSENCLYLNIWTPADASPENSKAVFYWIHGGGFREGSITDELFSGIALASQGDIVVVTVNYRLNTFGFLTTDTGDAPPNIGLYDILEGLKWVNNNIAAFGGDVQRITIAGESAGAISVGFLTMSPLTQGLYTRIIMESGTPLKPMNGITLNPANAQKLAKTVGCANESYTIAQNPMEVVQCLRGLDADVLSKADEKIVPSPINSFVPQFGDEFLPLDPETALFNGYLNCKDLFIGNNKDEGSLELTMGKPQIYGFFGEGNPRLNKTFGKEDLKTLVSKKFPNSTLDLEAILQNYFPDILEEDDSETIRHQVNTVYGDMLFLCPCQYYAEKCAEKNPNVYYYLFTHRPSVTKLAQWMGASHFEEIQFVFGQPLLNPGKYQASEVVLSRQMIEIWSNFVKTGIPDSSWPLYSRENPSFKYLGPKIVTGKVGSGLHSESCNLLRPLYNAD